MSELRGKIYDDLAHPAAVAIGKTLSLPLRAVNALLSPFEKWIIQREANLDAVSQEVAQKVENIPTEKLTSPEPYVAVPALQAISYSMGNTELRDMYANLLAKAINIDTKESVHPAYVEMIKQMSPMDALLLKQMHESGVWIFPIVTVRFQEISPQIFNTLPSFRQFTPGIDCLTNLISIHGKVPENAAISSNVENLARLQLVNLDASRFLEDISQYACFENFPFVEASQNRIMQANVTADEMKKYEIALIRGTCSLTSLGENFIKTCISM